ncbi:LLM class flavin-dependent oxidoreductase [Nitrospira moscoviensis]|uniref:Putative Alkanesulfonate monooxygenase n=1 Tax=Nitrospira moscoviensis TaxID=42253 RepID=A0A0K2GIG7_NITMO|nr:LLM class flavin-dependent oxidoreductase [Nitrospira moscoviensis]ALA60758.1 putative Alkanesulfonate monooxygenase [Nitrospira moscoviensis]
MPDGSRYPCLEVFSTCPQSVEAEGAAYLQKVRDVARWSEQYGCKGILVYADNRLVDPWLVAQLIIQQTVTLCPLVAVQPVYMHPYAAATMVSSLGHLYGRRVALNMIAGGFKNDLTALNDTTPHDRRYDRLVEYTVIMRRLLEGAAVTFDGEFYKITNLKLLPKLSLDLMPDVFVSGSSEAGRAAARAMNATAVHYPRPSKEYAEAAEEPSADSGIRVGIIARDCEEEAWEVAALRFPVDRKGQITRELAMKVSDSLWHKQLSELTEAAQGQRSVYWMVPFDSYKTNCPYLVGNYRQVADEVGRYVRAGHRKFILDIPPSEEELHHSATVFQEVAKGLVS